MRWRNKGKVVGISINADMPTVLLFRFMNKKDGKAMAPQANNASITTANNFFIKDGPYIICCVLSSFCFYSVHIATLIGLVVRYTPSSTDNLTPTKTQKSV